MGKCKTPVLLAALLILFLLCACGNVTDKYISGIVPQNQLLHDDSYKEYRDDMYGVKLSYPEGMKMKGAIDKDGHIMFTEDDTTITIYMPDAVSAHYDTAENYARSFLGLMKGNVIHEGEVTYDRCRGYEVASTADGMTTVSFVAKGKDTFYYFSYVCPENSFESMKKQREYVFNSIRIDDGTKARLTSLLSTYSSLLNFATSYGYITDANYAMHSIQNYMSTKKEYHLAEAAATYKSIQKSLNIVISHSLEKDCPFPELWENVYNAAQKLNEDTTQICALLEDDRASEAAKLAFSAFNYDLQLKAEDFLDALAAELDEY